ncbi:MAG: hypothetical protein ACJ8BW_16415 [Ktedonobacteraceae bacterium]
MGATTYRARFIAASADNELLQIHPAMGIRGRYIGAGRGKPAPTGHLGTTVGPDLSWAPPIDRPSLAVLISG